MMRLEICKIVTGLLIFLILGSCAKTTKYRPLIYGHDYTYGEIIRPVSYERISCRSPEFQDYVSFSIDDLAKVRLLIKHGKLPKKVRIILEKFDKDFEKIKRKNKALE